MSNKLTNIEYTIILFISLTKQFNWKTNEQEHEV